MPYLTPVNRRSALSVSNFDLLHAMAHRRIRCGMALAAYATQIVSRLSPWPPRHRTFRSSLCFSIVGDSPLNFESKLDCFCALAAIGCRERARGMPEQSARIRENLELAPLSSVYTSK
jgi:hypothetical protein